MTTGRAALVVATSTYEHLRLPEADDTIASARELAAVLADPRRGGFDVDLVLDRPAVDVRSWLRWQEPVHRVEFRLRAPAAALDRRIAGGVRVFLGSVIVGEVTFRIPVRATADRPVPHTEREPGVRYRQIFASYSHRDADVLATVAHFVTITGDRYLIDARDLRSGEVWQPRVGELIESADLFQLFWSRNAMESPFVRQEWEHALSLGRDSFIRPMYWEDPLPADEVRRLPPDALRRLHFSRLHRPELTRREPPARASIRPPPPSPERSAPGPTSEHKIPDHPPLRRGDVQHRHSQHRRARSPLQHDPPCSSGCFACSCSSRSREAASSCSAPCSDDRPPWGSDRVSGIPPH